MIFVTVGSALPFDRLIEAVDRIAGEGVLGDDVFAQIGSGTYLPKHCAYERFLDRARYVERFEGASFVISHAGIGAISSALRAGKAIAVMPRLKSHGELVDDHQRATAVKFQQLGHLLTFSSAEELRSLTGSLPRFVPAPRRPNRQGVASEVGAFLGSLAVAEGSEQASSR